MKKTILFTLAAIAIISTIFVACAPIKNKENEETTETEVVVEETDSETIGFVPSPERTDD